jgi:hypothetical protein
MPADPLVGTMRTWWWGISEAKSRKLLIPYRFACGSE